MVMRWRMLLSLFDQHLQVEVEIAVGAGATLSVMQMRTVVTVQEVVVRVWHIWHIPLIIPVIKSGCVVPTISGQGTRPLECFDIAISAAFA